MAFLHCFRHLTIKIMRYLGCFCPNVSDRKCYHLGMKQKLDALAQTRLESNLRALSDQIKAINFRQPIKLVMDCKGTTVYLGWCATIRGKRVRRYYGDRIDIFALAPEKQRVIDDLTKHIKLLNQSPDLLAEETARNNSTSPYNPSDPAKIALKPRGTGIIEHLLTWCNTYAEPNTKRNAQSLITTINTYIPWSVTNPPVNSITKGDCERFKEWLLTQTVGDHDPRKKSRNTGRRLDPATVEGRLTRLRTFFTWCERLELVTKSPAHDVRYSAPQKPVDFFTLDEITRLASTPTIPTSLDMREAFLFACHTGLRRVDLIELTFAQVGSMDFSGEFKIHPVSRITQQKTKHPVNIYVNSVTEKILRDQWDKCGDITAKVFNLQFSTRLCHAFATWCIDAKVIRGERSFSKARHSCATLIRSLGGDAVDVQRVLGHRNIRYTASRYLGDDAVRLSGVTAGLANIFDQKMKIAKKAKNKPTKKV